MALLDLRPNCECCNKNLPPETNEAMIWTYTESMISRDDFEERTACL